MGHARIYPRVMKHMGKHIGKTMTAKAIAKATGSSTSGVSYALRNAVQTYHQPVVEGLKGRLITFTYDPRGPEKPALPEGVRASVGEVLVSFPTLNGNMAPMPLSTARLVYRQLKSLFEK